MTATDMAVRENFHDARFCLVPASLDESFQRLLALERDDDDICNPAGRQHVGKGAQIDDPHHRRDHPPGEATRPLSIRDEKEKKPTGNLPRQRHQKKNRQSGSLSQQTRTPGVRPPMFQAILASLSCPLGGARRRKKQEAVLDRGCRAAFPGASQRGPFPDPSAQAISG